jgi:hypothetical protein
MIATILWRSIVSAIMPMTLRDIIQKLPQIADRLIKMAGYPKHQVENYRAKHQPKTRGLPVENY